MSEPWNSWKAPEPSTDFVDRVMDRVRAEPRPLHRSRAPYAFGGALALAAAVAAVWIAVKEPKSGVIIADARSEVSIGSDVLAVAESGARATWRSHVVNQTAGDIFYRVDKGAPFEVRTAQGIVRVGGTCFRVVTEPHVESNMKNRALIGPVVGAVAGVALTVIVYEGKVSLARESKKMDLVAGDAARVKDGNLERLSAAEAEAIRRANAGVSPRGSVDWARTIGKYQDQIREAESEKERLEKELAQARNKLWKETDGGASEARSEYDLTPKDWSELAKNGTVKYQAPCARPSNWKLPKEKVIELGINDDEAKTIEDAYAKSKDRLWSRIGPLCAKILGASAADRVGANSCTHIILDAEIERDKDATEEAMKMIGRVRAGEAQPPDAKSRSATFDLFDAWTGEQGSFERDLATTMDPSEARRLAYSGDLCMSSNTFNRSTKRK